MPAPEINPALMLALAALLPLALAGLALINTGLGRSRSAAQSLLGSLTLTAVAAIVYCIVGSAFTGFNGGPSASFTLTHASWNWIGHAAPLIMSRTWNTSPACFQAILAIFAVVLAPMIAWGSGADRWRLAGAAFATALLAAFIFPLYTHWVWAGGWLAQLGVTAHLGNGFVDPGGAATIQALGGLSALAIVWIIGPRSTKFSGNELPRAIPGHHVIYVLAGCLLLLPGWMALNGLGAILFAHVSVASLARVEADTLLAASASLLGSLLVTRARFGKPDASLCANGWVAGLVTSSAVAAYASPGAAIVIGVIAGAVLPIVIEALEVRCRIDDPSGGIPVHGLAGIWGIFALGLLHGFPAGQMLAQLIGIATLVGLIFPLAYALNLLANMIVPYRASAEGERVGMDLHELGAGAYPEFVTYSDEFIPR